MSAGVVRVRVFISFTLTVVAVPPRVAFMPAWNPLPRTVTAVPPEAGPDEGASVPMPKGTLASCTILRPLVVTANNRWPFSSVVRKPPCSPSRSVFSMANASGR